MENSIVTLGVYFEIKNSELYGGYGSVGYANTNVQLKISALEKANVCEYVEKQRVEIANLCHTDIEDVKVISKTEHDENTEEDEKDYDSDWLL